MSDRMNPEVREKINMYIRNRGLRRTKQRDVIVEATFSTEEHFTIDELWERARKIDPKTSRATLYRTVAFLVEVGVLREIELGKDQTYYDPNFLDKPEHNHLVCIDCGRVIEFEDEHMKVLEDCVTRRLGFVPTRKNLRIEAGCEQLRKDGQCEHLLERRLSKRRLS